MTFFQIFYTTTMCASALLIGYGAVFAKKHNKYYVIAGILIAAFATLADYANSSM